MRPSLQFQRRALIVGAGASALAVGYARAAHWHPEEAFPFRDLERHTGGRLGVHATYGGDGGPPDLVNRGGQRFPMCSSFKFILAACVLARVDAGLEHLDTPVRIPPEALLSYAPVTSQAAKEGRPLTVQALCEAAVKVSDNTAANLLLERVGGPVGLTRWMWKCDDTVTRLDRNEPSLNSAIPGDLRDTTTPFMMTGWLWRVQNTAVLHEPSRALLMAWMTDCTTGLTKLRAGAPKGWKVADKTGFNGSDTTADVAILSPPSGPGFYIAAYVTQAKLRGVELDAVFPEITKIVLKTWGIHG